MDDDDETNTKLSAGVERRDDLDEMDNSGGDSVSDLDRIFNRSNDKIQYKYRFAHSPTPSTLRLKSSTLSLAHQYVDVRRSQSVCSVRSYGIRKRFCAHRYGMSDADDDDSCSVDSFSILAKAQSTDHRKYKRQQHGHRTQNDPKPEISQFLERSALHSDIRRYSFSSRRGTKNFVINPLYDELNTVESR